MTTNGVDITYTFYTPITDSTEIDSETLPIRIVVSKVMPTEGEMNTQIDKFKEDLLTLDAIAIIHKHLVFDSCFLMDSLQYYDLKERIANQWRVHPSSVIMVGSAKLGFTISPTKSAFRHFSDTSDIDIAIVDGRFFEQIWTEVRNYETIYRSWDNQDQFRDYFFRGWMRPDMLPTSTKVPIKREWFEYFRELSSEGAFGPYKITCGLYSNWLFFEDYHLNAIRQKQDQVRNGI
jgi:hypothetical protein